MWDQGDKEKGKSEEEKEVDKRVAKTRVPIFYGPAPYFERYFWFQRMQEMGQDQSTYNLDNGVPPCPSDLEDRSLYLDSSGGQSGQNLLGSLAVSQTQAPDTFDAVYRIAQRDRTPEIHRPPRARGPSDIVGRRSPCRNPQDVPAPAPVPSSHPCLLSIQHHFSASRLRIWLRPKGGTRFSPTATLLLAVACVHTGIHLRPATSHDPHGRYGSDSAGVALPPKAK